jgi:prenyl protein peptidase
MGSFWRFLFSLQTRDTSSFPTSYFESCRHRSTERRAAILYGTTLAVSYVGALYLMVPSRIRKLHRDHPTQIQYRSMASVMVCLLAIVSYPYLFCVSNNDNNNNNNNEDYSLDEDGKPRGKFSLQHILLRTDFLAAVLAHTGTLYIGPIVASLIRVIEIRKVSITHGLVVGSYPADVFRLLWQPTLHSFLTPDSKEEFWKNVRNYVVAPWTEEIIFRGCMIPPLLASGMSVVTVSVVAPLFFGFAHLHHAITRLAMGERRASVVLVTTFQFLYTFLFGMYASYAFLRTGSILAVTLSHAYCNWMGLPDMSFVQLRHPMYRYRIVLLASFLIGVFAFKRFLKSDGLLPLPPTLSRMIHHSL